MPDLRPLQVINTSMPATTFVCDACGTEGPLRPSATVGGRWKESAGDYEMHLTICPGRIRVQDYRRD